jgi:uncharacterized RDD family membrane protein YckC
METTPPGSTPGSDPGQQGGSPPGGPQTPPAAPQAPQAPPGPPAGGVPQTGQTMKPVPTGPGGVPVADFGPRAGAFLIDLVIIIVGAVILNIILSAVAGALGDTGGLVTALVGGLAITVAMLLYAPFLMARGGANNGQTVGKQVLDLRVVREDGEPMTFGKGALREVVGRAIPWYFTCGVYGLLDHLWPLWDDERRAIHDMIAKTRVVKP